MCGIYPYDYEISKLFISNAVVLSAVTNIVTFWNFVNMCRKCNFSPVGI